MQHKQPAITVSVVSEYLPEQSSALDRRYVFAYHIEIANTGEAAAQLISRHWIITDADQQVQEVMGEGVIGEQPVIQPGQTYQYSSGAILKTPVGTMQGTYQMIDQHTGAPFNANIPVFRLASPMAIN